MNGHASMEFDRTKPSRNTDCIFSPGELMRVRAIGLLCAAITGVSACSSGAGHPGTDATVGTEADGSFPANPCPPSDVSLGDLNAAQLFGAQTIPVFDLVLPAADWEALKVHARDEQYVPAQACFQGKAIGLVGLRFKGSYGSLFNCFNAAGQNTCRKLGMKIELDKYVDEQSFHGLKRLNFQSYHYDDSYLKERLAYDVYRDMDIIAPRASWAVLRVNGDTQGLFGMVEEIDGRFTKDRWPSNGDANLFKERWPGNGDDAALIAGLKTNKKTADVGAFKAFSTALNAAAEADLRTVLGSYTDLDYFARYMAVDDAIANFDGITTYYTTSGNPDEAGNHNFYFYQEAPSKFTIIPWDLESTMSLTSNFGDVPSWQTTPADCTTTYLAWGGPLHVIAPHCDRVFRALSADLTSYRAAARRLLDGPFAQDALLAKVDALAAFIRPQATADPHGPGAATFESAVVTLRKEIPTLRARLEQLLSGKPIVPLLIDVASLNDFESADAYGVSAGTTCLSNAHTTAGPTVNESDPIDGKKTLRIVFDFGDETTAYQQWMFYRVPLARAPQDLSRLTGLRLKVRSSEKRILRLDVDSPKNSKASQGIAVGWNVSLDAATQTATVLFADARVPSWATDPGDSLTAILQSATALIFRPLCNDVNASGHLPDGVTDAGWADIDDVEFF
jgi:spore coat protein H